MNFFVFILERIIMIFVPIGTFLFIQWYQKEHVHEYDSEQIDLIEQYLIDYFSICDEPVSYEFSANQYTLQPSVIPVKGMEDIEVVKNQYYAGSLVSYFLDEKQDAYLLYHALCKRRPLKKRKQIQTIFLLKQLDKLSEIQDETIKELVFQLQNAFSLLYQSKMVTTHLQNYLIILNDILNRYQKLEGAGVMKEEVRKKTIQVLQETTIRVKKEAFQQDIDKV